MTMTRYGIDLRLYTCSQALFLFLINRMGGLASTVEHKINDMFLHHLAALQGKGVTDLNLKDEDSHTSYS